MTIQPIPGCTRRGVAIVMILVIMAVVGAAATGVHFATLRGARDSRDSLRRAHALAAAEYGLYEALAPAAWSAGWNTTNARGLLVTRIHQLAEGAVDTVRLWKLAPASFLLTSDAVLGAGPLRARRRLGLLVALRAPRIMPLAAATAREQITLSGASTISGIDTPVPHWLCPPTADALPAAAVADRSLVTTSDCDDASCLIGPTDILATPRAAEITTHERFGSTERSELAARGIPLDPGTAIHAPAPTLDVHGACDVANPRNLGDPLRALGVASPCADHFLVGHALGDLHIAGGAAQALLVVDGDLTLDAGVHLYGVAIVRGTLHLSGAAHLTGLALASRITLDARSRIDHSRCALATALRAAATPTVPRGPAWVEMY
jgi:hypothetical protein